MSMVNDFRLSFIWMQAYPDLMDEPQPEKAPFEFLGRNGSFAAAFEMVRDNPNGPTGLTVPWNQPAGKTFWTYYLEGEQSIVNGDMAWKAIVPMRTRPEVAPEAPWSQGKIRQINLEAFYYPFGIGLVFTARCVGKFDLTSMVDLSFDIRQRKRFRIRWQDEPEAELTLSAFADRLLSKLQWAALNQKPSSIVTNLNDPFSVLTVVQGDDVALNARVAAGGEIHRALEAVTTWNENADPTNELKILSDHWLPARFRDESHLFYAHRRSRAVWYPSRFLPSPEKTHSMACYHRNLWSASLQIESFGVLSELVSKRRRDGREPIGTFLDVARRAGGVAGRMYGGVDTYRTSSARKQIDDKWLASINSMRAFVQQSALK